MIAIRIKIRFKNKFFEHYGRDQTQRSLRYLRRAFTYKGLLIYRTGKVKFS